MPSQSWEQALADASSDGTALANTVTATSLLPTHAKYTLPAGFIDRLGKTLRVRATGRIGTVVTTPGTLTFSIRFGATTVATSGAFALNVVAQTNQPWHLEWELTARALGVAATMMHVGSWRSHAVVGSAAPTAGGAETLLIPQGNPAVGAAFDATVSQTVDFYAAWSVANAANSLQVTQFLLESVN